MYVVLEVSKDIAVCIPVCLTLKMKALCFFKMLGIAHPVTQYHIAEDLIHEE